MAKRRDNHDGSIRLRGKTWEGQVIVSGGKRVNVYGKSKTEVKSKIKEALAQAETDLQLTNPEITVKDWLEEWLNLYRSDIKRGTKDQCDTIITLHQRLETLYSKNLRRLIFKDKLLHHFQRPMQLRLYIMYLEYYIRHLISQSNCTTVHIT